MDPNQNMELIRFLWSGLKWDQIWNKTMLFASPIKSNCVCKGCEVFFVFKVNGCGSRITPSVQVWALPLLFLYTEHHHDVTVEQEDK